MVTPLDALYRCQRAWERTQPQLFMELWPDDGLDEPHPSAVRFVEPADAVASPEAGGLASRLTAGESLLAGVASTDATTGAEADLLSATGTSRSPAVSRVLNPGAEPCRDLLGTDGESALLTAPPATSDGSAPLTTTTPPVADPWQEQRDRGQEVTS